MSGRRPGWSPVGQVATLARWSEPLRTLSRSLLLVWEADSPRTVAYLGTTALLGLIPIATAWLAKLVLDRMSLALLHPGQGPLDQAAFVAAIWFVTALGLSQVLHPLEQQFEATVQTSVTGRVQQRMLDVGAAIPDADHFERKAFHDEIELLLKEVSWRPKNLLGNVHDVLRFPITLVGTMALLWHFQPFLPLALLAAAVPQVIVQQRVQQRLYEAIAKRSELNRMMTYCAEITTQPAAAKEVLVFGTGPWFYERWRQLAVAAVREMDRVRLSGLGWLIGTVGGNGLVLALAYSFVAAQVGGRHLTIGDFGLYLTAVAGLQQALTSLASGVGWMHGDLLFMRRLFAFLDETRPSIVVAPPGAGLPVPARFRYGIELRDVRFRYPGQAQAVLDGVSCTFGAGETVALVGANGAGKTTLVKLLCRLYDPAEGEITLDGTPLARYDLAGLRARTAVLFQDFAHFALSARHNVGVGDVAHADDEARVLAAARWAGADSVLARLPQGLDTPLTKAFAGGVELSGGEWQRVATARAAMRDAALVVLDEPTAALDAQAEAELFQRFRQLAEGRTVLLISHRFSTVRMADRILVLEDGRIVEEGGHAELVALGGRYATLYEIQAGRYR